MRINPENIQPGTERLQNQGVDQASRTKSGPVTADATAQSGGHANVNLSGRAQEVGRLVKIAEKAREIGADRVEALRQQIERGEYRVRHEEVAKRLLARTPATDSF